MEWLLAFGVDLVQWLQQASPLLDLPARSVTLMGSEGFFFLVIPFVYWAVDRNVGARLVPLFLLSVYLNAGLKHWADQPRPFQFAPTVMQLTEAGEGGFPSGHTQQTVVLWGFLVHALRRRWLYYLAGALLVLVPLSRLYLGVHFPHDILGGYVIGVVLVLVYLRFEPMVAQRVRNWPSSWQVGVALAVGLSLSFVVRTAYGITGPAVLAGVWVGEILDRRWLGFETAGTWRERALRYVLGLLIVGVVYTGLSLLQARIGGVSLSLRWAKYALLGLTMTSAVPWVFIRLGLARGGGHHPVEGT